jgi:fructokinase
MSIVYGGIEAGGTKWICALGTSPDDLREIIQFPTTGPEETIGHAISFFRKYQEKGPIAGIGIASFGPVDIDPASPTYGYITTTPKSGWSNTEFVGTIQRMLGTPTLLDTDVNAAALGEYHWGAAQGLGSFIYLTVGTGIGGGGMMNGQLMHGLIHPEMGHMRIPHDWSADPYGGCCPYHNDCLEGLAAAPALEQRWGQPPEILPAAHPAWTLEAHYLALGVSNLICTLSPQRIIMGGGVMKQPQLISMVRGNVQGLLNNYVNAPQILEDIDSYIVRPDLGEQSGILGAIALAKQSVQQ